MPFEFETLVGHLYIVSGRAISTAPPGALVEVAPKKAARGRETDTFFALALPTEKSTAPSTFYEQLAQNAAERYFESTGSVTSGLRETFNALNQQITEHNLGGTKTIEASMICAVLRGSDLIIGRIGYAAILFLEGGRVKSFPEDLSQQDRTDVPLGINTVPNIKMTQCHVTNGTRILFGDVHLGQLPADQIGAALQSTDLGTVLNVIKELARLHLSILAVEFVPPESPLPIPVPAGESTREIAAKIQEEAAKARRTAEVEATGSGKRRKPRQNRSTQEVQRKAKRSIGRAALSLANSLSITHRMVEYFFGEKDEGGKGWMSSPMGAATVVLLPIAVVGLVVFLWLSRQGTSAYELCIVDADSRADLARSLSNGERQTQINAWEVTLTKVDECETIRPGNNDMLVIRREGQSVIDGLNQITRYETRVIESFEGAQLSRIVYQGDNLYVLDAANDIVYRVQLDPTGRGILRLGSAIVRRGGPVEGILIGDIIDIGFNDQRGVMVLDRNGTLVTCTPRFLECSAQRLLGAENWVNPIAITVWSDRIYILDTGIGDGQIWRYERNSSGYGQPPSEVFGGSQSIRPNLRTAIDIDIAQGTIYVLSSDGTIQRFFNSQPQQFNYAVFPDGQEITSATSMYIDDTVTSQSLYIVSRARRTIYETTYIGTFDASYRVFNEENFNLLSAVAVAPGNTGTELMYVVSGNTVFMLEKR